ncbi:hypothetical protein ABPG74_014875 [Tetrahymena malaccensis]
MSLDYSEKMQSQQQQSQLQQAQNQHNYLFENIGAECISYHNEEEPAINYHQHYHQAQQQAAQYPFASAAAIHSNPLKEEQIYFLPHTKTTGTSNDFHNNNYQNYSYNYNYQTSAPSQQQFATPFSLGITGASKASQNTTGNANTQSSNFVFSNNNHHTANTTTVNQSNNKQIFTGLQQYSQKATSNTFGQNQYNFDLANQENIFLPNTHSSQYQTATTIVAAACNPSTTCSTQKTINQGQFYKNMHENIPSIQTLNDIDTVFSSTHDLQSMTNCTCPAQSNNNNNNNSNQQNTQQFLQLNHLVHSTSAPANYFYNENHNNKQQQAEGLVLDDIHISGMERKDSLEAKNEESVSSQHSLGEKYSKSSKNTSPILNAYNAPIRKSSESDSDATKSSSTLASNKQQSQLKNANKFCMVSLLNFLTDILPNSKEFHHLIKYIIRVKGSGKMRQKVDIFTLAHFRVLFLTLNDWNITQLNSNDIKMHKMIFSEVNKNGNWTKEDLDFMNSIKQQLLYISIQFFEDSANIKQKIQSKSWQNEDTAKHYIEWVNRIAKGIKKMSSGVYIHRF